MRLSRQRVRRASLAGAAAGLCAIVVASGPARRAPASVEPNSNMSPAGVLRGGVLTVTLEARVARWRPDETDHPPMSIEAFAEPGKAPLMPGPFLRAPAGTELHLSVRNVLHVPLTFFLPASLHGGEESLASEDSVVVAPGAVGMLTARATKPGNYVYRATTPRGVSEKTEVGGILAGAIVIDSAGAPAHPRDRVFVIMATPDSLLAAVADTAHVALANIALPSSRGNQIYTINGRSWPKTERVRASVGDSLHWRIISASTEPHPMHLHGFYFRVDQYQSPSAARFGHPAPGQMVVTQLMPGFSTMSVTWSPDRPGNWLFHCHFALHSTRYSLDSIPDPDMRDMVGLVLGVDVTARPGVTVAGDPAPARRLRLVATSSSTNLGHTDQSLPSMHFVLDDRDHPVLSTPDFSPEIDLTRGEPVAITIVNHLPEPTTIHWHGIELEDSYMDGVPDFSGSGKHLTPAIAPGDSFVARFTPPRAGTFMYHAHFDDIAEQLAGLEGALIVRERGDAPSKDDHVIFLKGRGVNAAHPLEIDGQTNPDTIVMHVGRPARFRLINLSTVNIAPLVSLTAMPDSPDVITRDSMLVRWQERAKDGFDLPSEQQHPQPARQIVAVGETYDFEYTPTTAGTLRLEFRTNGAQHRLLIRVPIRVQ